MTREEAYEIIEEVRDKICSRKYVTEQSEAFDMALELLKQEPCEDAISRKDIIAKIEDEYEGYMLDETCCPQDFVYMIVDMPSIQPKPKIGHWIKYSNGDVCSECGYDTGKYEDGKHYCPKCGAKNGGRR